MYRISDAKGGNAMDACKILIADGTEDFRLALAESLQENYYVRSCKDGQEALSLLKSFTPDILVLDLFLPGIDGISLLHAAAESGIRPLVLATGKFFSDYMMDSLVQLGVEYVLTKPCDLRSTIARIQDLTQRIHTPLISQPDPRNLISTLLITLGIPVNYHGYGYLREAILLIARKPDQGITKELYPAIAKIFGNGLTDKNVERSIRNAIETAWKTRDERIWQQYFPSGKNKPTNGQFLHALADSLRLHRSEQIG